MQLILLHVTYAILERYRRRVKIKYKCYGIYF